MKDQGQYRFGDFEVLRPIGTGGMAALFLCRKTGVGGFERDVVVKVLLEEFLDKAEFRDMFMDEARLAARLNHPNLVQAIDVGMAGKFPYMAMDYVRGPNLSRLSRVALKRNLVNYGAVARILAHATAGLDFAHQLKDRSGKSMGVIHRDLSPNNIMVSALGDARLIDFGVAKGADRLTKTTVGMIKGKIQYMAPEQLVAGKYDHRADVFAAGVTLYVVSTGERPFQATEGGDLLQARFVAEFPKPSDVCSDYPEALERVVLKAMARRPEDRYQTAGEMSRDLADFASSLQCGVNEVAAWVDEVLPGGETHWLPPAGQSPSSSELLAASGTLQGPADITDQSAITTINKGLSVLLVSGLLLVSAAAVGVGTMLYASMGEEGDDAANIAVAAYLNEAEVLEGEQRYQASIDLLQRAREGGATDPALNIRVERMVDDVGRSMRLLAAERALTSGDFEAAKKLVGEVLDRSPTDVEAVALMTRLHALLQPVAEPEEDVELAETDAVVDAISQENRPSSPVKARKKVVEPGTLTVRTTPPGAIVFLDDLPLGPAPLDASSLSPGTHMLTIRAEGFEAHEMQIDVAPGQSLDREIALVAIEMSPTEEDLAEVAALAAVVAVRAPEPEPEPELPTLKMDDAALPAAKHVRTLNEVQSICLLVEQALVRGGHSEQAVSGATGGLLRSISADFTPGRAIDLYPRGMYRYIAEQSVANTKPGALRSGLTRAHLQGKLK